MKTIYIIRHAKAEELSPIKRDFDRTLTPQGKADAMLIGKQLQLINVKPSLILSSPALRALETARIIVDELDLSTDNIITDKKIYEASLKTLLTVISQCPDKVSNLMIFGHNPSFKDLVNYLSDKIFQKLPKGSVVGLSFKTDKWGNIKKRSGKVSYYEYPKNIRTYSTLKAAL